MRKRPYRRRLAWPLYGTWT